MVKKKLIAYFTNDSEKEKAKDKIIHTEASNSFVFAEAEENDITYLRQSGLIVETLADNKPQQGVSKVSKPLDKKTRSDDIEKAIEAPSNRDSKANKTNFYNIQLEGPLF